MFDAGSEGNRSARAGKVERSAFHRPNKLDLGSDEIRTEVLSFWFDAFS